jgi:hypothetical protein
MTTRNVVAGFTMGLAFAAISWGSGSQAVKSRDGSCQVTVPGDWSPSQIGGMAQSPDKKLLVTLSSPKMIDSFNQLKQTAQSVYPDNKVTKSSATEFEMEGLSTTGKADVYRAVPIAGNKFCIVEVTYEGSAHDQAKSIGATLQAAK